MYALTFLLLCKEAARWTPSLNVVRFHGHKNERNRLKNEIRAGNLKCNIMVTTYDAYVAEDSWFKTRRWFYCVLDEGHKIKNAETGVSSKLQGIGALYRLGERFKHFFSSSS